METILDFLSKNYIWFFVTAVVLIFALIGFMVQSKRKNKNKEFKGESIPTEPVANNAGVMEINDIPIEDKIENKPMDKIEFFNESPTTPSMEPEPIPTSFNSGYHGLGTMPVLEPQPIKESVIEQPQETVVQNNEPVQQETVVQNNEPVQQEPIVQNIQPNFQERVVQNNEPIEQETLYDEPIITQPVVTPTFNFDNENSTNNF